MLENPPLYCLQDSDQLRPSCYDRYSRKVFSKSYSRKVILVSTCPGVVIKLTHLCYIENDFWISAGSNNAIWQNSFEKGTTGKPALESTTNFFSSHLSQDT